MPDLTTAQIVEALAEGMPDEEWEAAAQRGAGGRITMARLQEMTSAARFLESWRPGRRWSASQFGELVENHMSGPYDSWEELGIETLGYALQDQRVTREEAEPLWKGPTDWHAWTTAYVERHNALPVGDRSPYLVWEDGELLLLFFGLDEVEDLQPLDLNFTPEQLAEMARDSEEFIAELRANQREATIRHLMANRPETQ